MRRNLSVYTKKPCCPVSLGLSGWLWPRPAASTSSKSRSTRLDARLARLERTKEERLKINQVMLETGIRIPTMCLSGHRRYPFGSRDPQIRQQARDLMEKAIVLAQDLGIRTIQLAGYDVYYEEQDEGTIARFEEGLQWAVERAAAAQVMIGVEIMDRSS